MTEYASIMRRLGASFLDLMILGVIGGLINMALPVIGPVLVVLLYAPVFESSEARATIGKYLMGIQVTDLSGRRITFQAALIRIGMKFVSSCIMFLGHVLALFTQKKQALHDLVAETVVVYGRTERSIVDCWVDQVRSLFRAANLTSAESSPSRSAPGCSKPGASRVDELERLQALREKGVLTEEEFQSEKARILGVQQH